MGNVYPAGTKVIEKEYRDDKCGNAKQLLDKKARELRRQGYTVKTYKYDYTDLGRFILFGLSATK